MLKKLTAFLLAIFMIISMLTGCGTTRQMQAETLEQTEEPTRPVEEKVPTYKVSFVMAGHVLSEQNVEQEKTPETVEVKVEGLVFSHWVDAQGQAVDPFTQQITAQTRFDAVYYPDISRHVPFLQVDENGLLRPDESLSMDDLYFALHNLAVPGAEDAFPGLFTGSAAVTLENLTSVLSYFFPADAVEAAFTEEPTRATFAKGLLSLLGRSVEEKQALAAEAVLPGDVHAGRADAAILLEASMEHTPDETGANWNDVELPSGYEPGFVNIDGWLYYVKEDGYFLKNDKVGALNFGADGRYTSGDAELDQQVAERLARFATENPEMTRFELLRVAYDHCVLDYKYLRKAAYGIGAMGWEIEDGKKMFESGVGNCYGFAAIFWALARGLGYEAYVISGTCTGTDQPHGWVIIEIDGADYFFDPEWHYAYINENRPVKDMFMIAMEDIWYWSYKWTLY